MSGAAKLEPVTKAKAIPAQPRKPKAEIAAARAERDALELELAVLQVRTGDREPPATIATVLDARLWLAWAHGIGHQAGCACHRCPKARRLTSTGSAPHDAALPPGERR